MKVEVLGIKIDQVTYQQSLEEAKKMINAGGKHYVVTPNPEMIVAAQSDSQFRDILTKADLAIADGFGLVKLANLTGRILPERIAGVDFVQGLAALAQEFGFNMFLLGAAEDVADKAANNLKKVFPKLKIVGTFSGDADETQDHKALSVLKSKKIDILIVAYGQVKQEKWIKRNLPKLNVKLAIGVGGALDFISGNRRRAPVWLQRAGLEWAFRLINEPWRLKRQFALPYFVYLVIREKLKKS